MHQEENAKRHNWYLQRANNYHVMNENKERALEMEDATEVKWNRKIGREMLRKSPQNRREREDD